MSFFPLGDDKYKEDINTLDMYCGDELIGTHTFDLSKFIGLPEALSTDPPLKAVIANDDSNAEILALVGDASKYPGTYIEFRVIIKAQEKVAK